MATRFGNAVGAAAILMAAAPAAQAASFELGTLGSAPISGSWNTTLTESFGIRTQDPSCALTGDPSQFGCGSSANTRLWSVGDNGNLNYKSGQPFTVASKATTELLLKMPSEGLTFMGRASFMYDAVAADTNRTGLSDSAMDRVVHNEQLYDLWLGKSFQIGDVNGRIRAGNQVINWGESLFLFGGINATNAIDYQKSLIPGTQIKEYVLPAPLVSVAANILPGVNVEGYYQLMYNKNIYPPVGSYWSMADIFGPGARDPITFNPNNFNWYGLDPAAQQRLKTGGQFAVPGLGDKYPGGGGQYGLSMHYKPAGSVFDWGVYYLRYNDKAPVLNLVTDPTAPIGLDYQFTYRSERSLYGISTNFPVGDWAIGSEFSYRPRDAISLGSCFTPGVPLDSNVNVNPIPSQNCPLWADKDRQDLHVTALLQLSPSDYPFILHNLRADTGFLSLEVAGTRYGGINKNGITRTIEGVQVTQLPAAGYVNWLSSTDLSNPNAVPRGVGSEYSAGAVADFNWTYDSTVIPGWQVTPGITYFNAFLGNTPNFAASYLQGAQSVNLYVLFNQNPAVWQAGLNYTAFFGGQEASKQPYSDRSFVGGFVSFNF